MQGKMTNSWVKITLIALTVMMFISLFKVEAGQDELIINSEVCSGEDYAMENLAYLKKGVEIWNNSKNKQSELIEAVNSLALGLDYEDGCLYVKSVEDVAIIINDLEKAGLSKSEMVNAQIKRLNKSGYIEPISRLVIVEK
jgi:hypothetical protein